MNGDLSTFHLGADIDLCLEVTSRTYSPQLGIHLVKVRGQYTLTVLHPSLHVGAALVDVVVGDPVLSDLAQVLEVRYRDTVSSDELAVFEEVVLCEVESRL